MKNVVRRVAEFVYRLTASEKFFYFILGLFVVQAVWLAFTAIYPMPFDEFAHVGAIQLYAEQWSWVVTQQPIDTGVIGDLTREPSFLYRWLMSYPYRLLNSFLSVDQVIITMRLMNITMVAGGIILFKKLLREWGISRRITNVVLLAFVMTPIIPFLAAHVNYDNLMFLLAPLVLLYAGRLVNGNDSLLPNIAIFVLTGTATVLAKETFLPLILVATLYVGFVVIRRNWGSNWRLLQGSLNNTPKDKMFYLVVAGLIILAVMVGERYVGNIAVYGSYRPACEVVQPVELCSDFGPWYRNNVTNVQNRPAEPPYGNPLSFSQYWISRMMRGYFALFQHTPTQVVWEKEPFGPIVVRPLLPLPINFAVFVALFGLLAVVWQRRKIWKNRYLRFSAVVITGYVLILWTFNYNSYLKMWKAEAIQARYTYPLLVLVFTLIAWAVSQAVASRKTKAWLVVAMFVFYVWGGGIAGWLIRADENWRWQHPVTQSVNVKLQTLLRYTVFH